MSELSRGLADDLASDATGETAVTRALGVIGEAVGAAGAAVYVTDRAGGPLARWVATGVGLHFEARVRTAPDGFDCNAVRRAGRDDEALLATPIEAGSETLGYLVLALPGEQAGEVDSRDSRLTGAATLLALALVNERLSEALAGQEGVRRDLALAADLQRGLLPENDFRRCPVIGLNRPARLVSGDFFDFFWRTDGRIPFALGDVAGKGVNAALLMAKAASLFRCLAKTCDEPAALLATINREICETTSRGMFVTMVVGIYDQRSGHVRFANAGHEPPLLRHTDRSYRTFPAEAPPLGILASLEFATHEADLGGGEFYIFTDGLTEFSYGGDEMLGVDGLIQMIEASPEAPFDVRLDSVLGELDSAGWEARDDLTVLAIDDGWVGAPPEMGELLSWEDRTRTKVPEAGWEAPLFELRFPARADRLKLIRAEVAIAARMCGFHEFEARDIVLAVDEACQNVVRHAYGDATSGDAVLTVARRNGELAIRLRDFAPVVDRTTITPRPLGRVVPGGLGTHFIRTIMDDVSYLEAVNGRGNLLEMIKRIPDREGEHHADTD